LGWNGYDLEDFETLRRDPVTLDKQKVASVGSNDRLPC